MGYDIHDLPTQVSSRINVIEETGCWEWTGHLDRDGYGRVHAFMDGKNKTVLTHRYAYATLKGELIPGLCLDHKCRNRACCCPEHLEQVTPRENVVRGIGSSALGAASARCPRCNAEYTVRKDGRRVCVACHRLKSEEWDRQHPERRREISRAVYQRRKEAGLI